MLEFLDPTFLVTTVGYLGIFFIVFAAGFLASQDYLNIWILILLTFVAAILGDSVGYMFGWRMGPKIFRRDNSIFFHKDHIRKAEKFYEQHGPKTIMLARFLPIIRTFAPIVAGVGKMRYPTFLLYNVIGGVLWGIGIPVLGYWLGSIVPGVDQYLVPIIFAIIVLSVLPGFYHVMRERSRRRA